MLGNLDRTSLTTHLGILSSTASIRSPSSTFTSYIHWVLPETAFLEGPPVCVIVLSPPDVVLYMGCSKANVFPTVGTHTWSLPTVNAHLGSMCCSSAVETIKGMCCSSKHE